MHASKEGFRPGWFSCERCLFFLPTAEICVHHPMPVEKSTMGFCAQWTCQRCWRGWQAIPGEEALIDHRKCPKIAPGE